MNAQERDTLNQLLNQLVAIQLTQKDSEAEALIRQAVSRQPDSHYLLVQKTLLQNEALKQAQAKIEALQTALDQRTPPTADAGFFSNNAWGNHAPQATRTTPIAPPATPAAPAAAPAMGSSWLGNVATTAAGVVAGSFLFQGIENLMGHHNGGNGFGSAPIEETVVNNYYDSPAPSSPMDQRDVAFNDTGSADDNFFDTGSSDDSSDWA